MASPVPPRPINRPKPAGQPTAKPAVQPSIKAGSNPFADLMEESSNHGRFLMIYSEAGEGKTTLAAQFPSPMFVTTSGEQGIQLYRQQGLVPKSVPVIPLAPLFDHQNIPSGSGHPGWLKLVETLERFKDADHAYQTLVIDSTSGLQDLCFQHGASVLFDGDMTGKDYSDFYRGYSKSAENFWAGEFLPLCLAIVAAGKNVVLIAHSTFKTVSNPVGPDFDQFRPALMKSIFEYTKKDLHGIYFLGREIRVTIDSKTKKKSATGDRRFIGLSPNPYYVAKSWVTPQGVNEIECGENARETWAVLKEAIGL